MADETTPEVTLPFWMSGPELTKLARAAQKWFALLMGWAIWPVQQMDPETCTETVLDLIAWQRDISRFNGEPLALYRLRVKYAYINAKDAGSVAGFKRIFQRLGVGYLEIEERMPGRDWDVIGLQLSDTQLADNQALLQELIQHYGRTCRRYEWTLISPLPISIRVETFDNDYQTFCASVPPLSIGPRLDEFNNDSAVITAKL
ncbi:MULTISPECIES: phage tail protein [unclassified Pseudodesulfovibrio]|uniref:phage tail protein n=1 Tax=unclassified Pseudodesulfovibrio TaxID=2661612 RepID=UPI000FEC0E87|nr:MULTISPECIES: phage tail protein [unclassified Pseudodesulfovibrio]MCJ2164663.1 phage tail protein [Pseudodesulfovibrio sp. S3-i]RWU04145.1 phage tail protein [Pseudodesulfovibrio sp. S3]